MTNKQVHDLQEILEIANRMAQEKNLDALLKIIMEGVTRLLDADLSSLFLCDYENNEFYSRFVQQSEISEIRFPLEKGIAGSVARTKKTINIEDAYQDSRFNPDIDKQTGYQTKNILCMPLLTREDMSWALPRF